MINANGRRGGGISGSLAIRDRATNDADLFTGFGKMLSVHRRGDSRDWTTLDP